MVKYVTGAYSVNRNFNGSLTLNDVIANVLASGFVFGHEINRSC